MNSEKSVPLIRADRRQMCNREIRFLTVQPTRIRLNFTEKKITNLWFRPNRRRFFNSSNNHSLCFFNCSNHQKYRANVFAPKTTVRSEIMRKTWDMFDNIDRFFFQKLIWKVFLALSWAQNDLLRAKHGRHNDHLWMCVSSEHEPQLPKWILPADPEAQEVDFGCRNLPKLRKNASKLAVSSTWAPSVDQTTRPENLDLLLKSPKTRPCERAPSCCTESQNLPLWQVRGH